MFSEKIAKQKETQCLHRQLKYIGITKLWTTCMQQTLFWDAASSVATKAISCILWNPNCHYRVHNSPPLVSVMSQINPIHVRNNISWRTILILSTYLHLSPPSNILSSGSPTKTLYIRTSTPRAPLAPPTASFLIGHQNNLSRNTDHEAPHYVFLSSSLLPPS